MTAKTLLVGFREWSIGFVVNYEKITFCLLHTHHKGDFLDVSLQIFEEEHNVWFLDKGGALVAVKQPSVPTRHLWYVHLENFFGQPSFLKMLFQFPTAILKLIQPKPKYK